MRRAGLLAFLVLPAAVSAAEVESVEVAHPGERYTVAMRVQLGVPAADAYAVMTDFPNLPRVNDNLVVAEPLPGERLRTVVEMCVAFFCKRIRQVQTVELDPRTRLAVNVVPAESDLRFGAAEWRFEALGPERSRIHFAAELEPDFWVPPVIGPWLIQRKLKTQAVKTSRGIEREARERAR